MIEVFQSWEQIFEQIGERPPKRGRGKCPLCGCKTGFATYENRRFKCFACQEWGDKLDLIQRYHQTDLKGALAFLGLSPTKPPTVDPAILSRHREEAARLERANRIGRRLRDEYYHRLRIIAAGKARLEANPEDETGWGLLRIGYQGADLDELEAWLDRIDIGKPERQLDALKEIEIDA